MSSNDYRKLPEAEMRRLHPKAKNLYALYGCCSTWVDFSIDKDNRIRKIELFGGCPGMRRGLCALIEGREVNTVIKLLRGIQCRKNTSCPDAIARALQKHMEKLNDAANKNTDDDTT